LVYGMQLQVQAQSRTFAEPWELDAGRDELAAIARKADETGFFYVGVCDHVAVPKPLDEHMRTTWYEPVATLGWLAGITSNVRLLSHVLVAAYRHPLVTAKAFMTLDELSAGRAILGVGTGHVPRGAAGVDRLSVGAPEDDSRRRGDRHRYDHRDALHRRARLGRGLAHALRPGRPSCRTAPRVRRHGCEPPAGAIPQPLAHR